MIKKIPKVPVQVHGSGEDLHSYLSIKDCLKHYLMFGGFGMKEINDDNSGKINTLLESKHCTELCKNVLSPSFYNENTMIFLIVLFSDDFDPSVSLVKANRRSIWTYTLTFKSQIKILQKINIYTY